MTPSVITQDPAGAMRLAPTAGRAIRRAPPAALAAFVVPGLACFALFFVLPLAAVLGEALREGLSPFARLAADGVFWSGLRGSLALGLSAALFSLAVGVPVALVLARLSGRARTALLVAISLPLTFSGVIVAYGFILLMGRAGFVTLLLAHLGCDPAVVGGFIYSPAGLGFAYSYYLVPRVVLIVLPAAVSFDEVQLAAARSLGARPLRAVVDVLLPQIVPSLLAAFCLTATVAIGAYGTALALVGTQINILPLLLYSKVSETGTDLPAAAAVSVVLMALCSAVILAGEWLAAFRRR